MILERILTKYPIPVTVSVVEANVRGLEKGLRPEQSDGFEKTARAIFALPQVEAATHTFSHPFVWLDSDVPYEGQHEKRNLDLHRTIDYPRIDFEREIVGSADYVRTLLPDGERCRVGVVVR